MTSLLLYHVRWRYFQHSSVRCVPERRSDEPEWVKTPEYLQTDRLYHIHALLKAVLDAFVSQSVIPPFSIRKQNKPELENITEVLKPLVALWILPPQWELTLQILASDSSCETLSCPTESQLYFKYFCSALLNIFHLNTAALSGFFLVYLLPPSDLLCFISSLQIRKSVFNHLASLKSVRLQAKTFKYLFTVTPLIWINTFSILIGIYMNESKRLFRLPAGPGGSGPAGSDQISSGYQ